MYASDLSFQMVINNYENKGNDNLFKGKIVVVVHKMCIIFEPCMY